MSQIIIFPRCNLRQFGNFLMSDRNTTQLKDLKFTDHSIRNKRIMQPEFNHQQSDWLNQAEELNDNDAAQVNGGINVLGLTHIRTYANIYS